MQVGPPQEGTRFPRGPSPGGQRGPGDPKGLKGFHQEVQMNHYVVYTMYDNQEDHYPENI